MVAGWKALKNVNSQQLIITIIMSNCHYLVSGRAGVVCLRFARFARFALTSSLFSPMQSTFWKGRLTSAGTFGFGVLLLTAAYSLLMVRKTCFMCPAS